MFTSIWIKERYPLVAPAFTAQQKHHSLHNKSGSLTSELNSLNCSTTCLAELFVRGRALAFTWCWRTTEAHWHAVGVPQHDSICSLVKFFISPSKAPSWVITPTDLPLTQMCCFFHFYLFFFFLIKSIQVSPCATYSHCHGKLSLTKYKYINTVLAVNLLWSCKISLAYCDVNMVAKIRLSKFPHKC